MWSSIFDIFLVYIIFISIGTFLVIFWIYVNADYLEKTEEKDDKLDTIDYIAFAILLANPIIELVLFYLYIKDNYT